MKQIAQFDTSKNEVVDFPTIITVICHLMTLYALNPCEPLATNINRHIKVILDSSASESLGEWKGTFRQILSMWELIAEKHVQTAKPEHPIISH